VAALLPARIDNHEPEDVSLVSTSNRNAATGVTGHSSRNA
jgi:hypothetical protein